MSTDDSAGRTDTHNTRDNPRAAGAASDRGAQPSDQRAKRITICCYCRKRVYRQKDGTWYHERNGSTSCRPGEGSDRRAAPLEIEVAERQKADAGRIIARMKLFTGPDDLLGLEG